VNLVAGTYTLILDAPKSSDRGIVTAVLDGTTVATVDLYAASSTQAITDTTSIVVGATGMHKLMFQTLQPITSCGELHHLSVLPKQIKAMFFSISFFLISM
jgi:hypothetical protein